MQKHVIFGPLASPTTAPTVLTIFSVYLPTCMSYLTWAQSQPPTIYIYWGWRVTLSPNLAMRYPWTTFDIIGSTYIKDKVPLPYTNVSVTIKGKMLGIDAQSACGPREGHLYGSKGTEDRADGTSTSTSSNCVTHLPLFTRLSI